MASRYALPALGGNSGALCLEGGHKVPAWRLRSSTRPARARRWPSMADRAVLVLPRLAISSISLSIWPSRRSRWATVWVASSIRAARVASRVLRRAKARLLPGQQRHDEVKPAQHYVVGLAEQGGRIH